MPTIQAWPSQESETPPSRRPAVIYHYCSVEAMCGIVQSKNLWLSNAYALNDYRENTWIVPLINQQLADLRTEKTSTFLDDLASHYDLNDYTPYVASFSVHGDLLSQWRAYAGDATGVAVGFDPSAFHVKFRLPLPGATVDLCTGLASIVYDTQQQGAYVRRAIEESLQSYLAERANQANAMLAAVSLLRRFASAFKNPAFREEGEWRLIHVPLIMGDVDDNTTVCSGVSPLRFRAIKGKLTSYFEFPLTVDDKTQPIVEVVIGPKCEASESSIKLMLTYNGYRKVAIRKSSVSYR